MISLVNALSRSTSDILQLGKISQHLKRTLGSSSQNVSEDEGIAFERAKVLLIFSPQSKRNNDR
jgi:hypothetical protein